jgi:hypothetical protein
MIVKNFRIYLLFSGRKLKKALFSKVGPLMGLLAGIVAVEVVSKFDRIPLTMKGI